MLFTYIGNYILRIGGKINGKQKTNQCSKELNEQRFHVKRPKLDGKLLTNYQHYYRSNCNRAKQATWCHENVDGTGNQHSGKNNSFDVILSWHFSARLKKRT